MVEPEGLNGRVLLRLDGRQKGVPQTAFMRMRRWHHKRSPYHHIRTTVLSRLCLIHYLRRCSLSLSSVRELGGVHGAKKSPARLSLWRAESRTCKLNEQDMMLHSSSARLVRWLLFLLLFLLLLLLLLRPCSNQPLLYGSLTG